MTRRYVTLPAVHSKPVALGRYVAFVKFARAHPDAEMKHGLTCWWPVTGREVVSQFREAMHERISAAQPYHTRGLA